MDVINTLTCSIINITYVTVFQGTGAYQIANAPMLLRQYVKYVTLC